MFVCGEREKEWEREREGEREYPVVKGYGNKGKVPNKLLATRQKRDTERVEKRPDFSCNLPNLIKGLLCFVQPLSTDNVVYFDSI